jgi:hypothetical protein
MLLAGIQGKSGLDPRLKPFGGDDFGISIFSRGAIFEGGHEEHEVGVQKSEFRAQKSEGRNEQNCSVERKILSADY